MDNRSFESAASATPPSAPASPSSGYPTNGNPSLAIPATVPGDYWFHQFGEEMRNVIEDASLTPDAADLTQLSQAIQVMLSQASSVQGSFKNLQASATGTSANVTVSADELVVESATYAYKVLRAVSLTIAGTTTGANALDTGTIATSTWYSVWVIWNGTTTAGLLSLSATAPTMPSGYTHKARVGWIRTDGTANKYPLGFKQYGRRVQYLVAAGSNLTALPVMSSGVQGSTTTPTWVAVATGAFVPTTAASVNVILTGNGSTGVSLMAAPNAAYGARTASSNQPPIVISSASGAQCNNTPASIILETTNIYFAADGGAMLAAGWEDSL